MKKQIKAYIFKHYVPVSSLATLACSMLNILILLAPAHIHTAYNMTNAEQTRSSVIIRATHKLHEAIIENNHACALEAIYEQADVNELDVNQSSILIKAISISKGTVSLVSSLLEHKADINIQNKYGNTALMYAATEGYTIITYMLLQYKADTHLYNNHGHTALIFAAKNGHAAIINLLLEHNANSNTQNKFGDTALIWAALHNYPIIVHALLTHKANVNIQNEQGDTALIRAAINGHTTIINLLLEHNANSNTQNKFGDTALIWAANKGHLSIVETLMAHNADPDIINNKGITALEAATPPVKKFFRKSIEIATDKLFKAVIDGNTVLALEAIQERAHINVLDTHGDCLLTAAAYYGHGTIANALLEHKANINSQNDYGDTALIRAADNGQTALVHLLLEHKANTDIQDKNGDTALLWLAKKNHSTKQNYLTIIETLIAHDADPGIANILGQTALLVAKPKTKKIIKTALNKKVIENLSQQNWDVELLLQSGILEQFVTPELLPIICAYADPYYTTKDPLYTILQHHIQNNQKIITCSKCAIS